MRSWSTQRSRGTNPVIETSGTQCATARFVTAVHGRTVTSVTPHAARVTIVTEERDAHEHHSLYSVTFASPGKVDAAGFVSGTPVVVFDGVAASVVTASDVASSFEEASVVADGEASTSSSSETALGSLTALALAEGVGKGVAKGGEDAAITAPASAFATGSFFRVAARNTTAARTATAPVA